MFLSNVKQPVRAGEIDTFTVSAERPEFSGKKANQVRLTFKRVRDEATFNYSVGMNVWVVPEKFNKLSGSNFANKVKSLQKQNDEVNALYEKAMSGDANASKEYEIKRIELTQTLKMIGLDQLVDHLINLFKVTNVPLTGISVDTRMLNLTVEEKKDNEGNPVVDARGNQKYAGKFDFAGYDSIIDTINNNLAGKKFRMVVGGEFGKNGEGPYPGISKTRKLAEYLESADVAEEDSNLSFRFEAHVDSRNQKAAAPVTTEDDSDATDDLPF